MDLQDFAHSQSLPAPAVGNQFRRSGKPCAVVSAPLFNFPHENAIIMMASLEKAKPRAMGERCLPSNLSFTTIIHFLEAVQKARGKRKSELITKLFNTTLQRNSAWWAKLDDGEQYQVFRLILPHVSLSLIRISWPVHLPRHVPCICALRACSLGYLPSSVSLVTFV